jgi:glycosyltransferase involved in cell wall biosynthesis
MKPVLLFRGPVETRSGYGSHSRDILKSFKDLDLFEIYVDSCNWGLTPTTALEKDNEYHEWIKSKITNNVNEIIDVYVQVTIPNEFQRLGKFNIGVTAGIETTIAPKDWVDGCNRMDLIITTSNFSRDVLLQTVYNENEKITGKLIKQHRIEKPVQVLFEGVDDEIYNDKYSGIDLDFVTDFNYIFVGHWLKGSLGNDRKDVGMLIKCFVEAFKNEENKPGLILKTSAANFSVRERENFRKKIKNLVKDIENPPHIYLLFGELTDKEMNELYNHPKVKSMVSITKGEGFGRPLLEFSMTGKPIIASNWSGHKDFLPMDKAVMVGGTLTDVDDSATDSFILKGSKWFTANYNEFIEVMKIVKNDYEKFTERSEMLKNLNLEKFTIKKMTEKLNDILKPIFNKPVEKKIVLPVLNKIN